jgi:hypothetical protein
VLNGAIMFPPAGKSRFPSELFAQSFAQILPAVLAGFLPNFPHKPIGQHYMHAASVHTWPCVLRLARRGLAAEPFDRRFILHQHAAHR